jgi:hypothetical protein
MDTNFNKIIQVLGVFFVALLLLPLSSSGQQNDYQGRKCYGYQRDSCPTSENIYYKRHEDSRSALFLKGQSSRTNFEIYNGRDYRISLCWDPVLGGPIQFKLINQETNSVLYDNATDEFASEFEFTVTQRASLYIEITVPGESETNQAMNNDDIILVRKDKEVGCVGILIEYMVTPPKGF